MSTPYFTYFVAIFRILRYVKRTLFYGLHFLSSLSLELCAYSNADWAGNPIVRQSTTTYYLLLRDSLISLHRKKQTVVARSSTKVEHRPFANTISELFLAKMVIKGYKYSTFCYYAIVL